MNAALHVPEGHQAGHVALGVRHELQGHLGDDAEGALRADHQVQEAVAGAGLADRLAKLEDAAVRQHHRHGQDIVPRDAVLHRAHAAGICRDVAADGGRLLARVGRIQEAAAQGVGRQVLQEDARLKADDEVFHVVAEDPVHAASAQHEPSVQRHAATHQARARAAAGHGDFIPRADLHDGRDLFRRLDIHRGLGHEPAVDGHLVMGVVGVRLAAEEEAPRGNAGTQLFRGSRGDFVVGRHGKTLLCQIMRGSSFIAQVSRSRSVPAGPMAPLCRARSVSSSSRASE